jgi:hypothetical protein
MEHVQLVIDHVRTRWPYWDRNGGRDHFMWVPADRGACHWDNRFSGAEGREGAVDAGICALVGVWAWGECGVRRAGALWPAAASLEKVRRHIIRRVK